jgi:hypothetical protein
MGGVVSPATEPALEPAFEPALDPTREATVFFFSAPLPSAARFASRFAFEAETILVFLEYIKTVKNGDSAA